MQQCIIGFVKVVPLSISFEFEQFISCFCLFLSSCIIYCPSWFRDIRFLLLLLLLLYRLFLRFSLCVSRWWWFPILSGRNCFVLAHLSCVLNEGEAHEDPVVEELSRSGAMLGNSSMGHI
jgi:hypothetical protein